MKLGVGSRRMRSQPAAVHFLIQKNENNRLKLLACLHESPYLSACLARQVETSLPRRLRHAGGCSGRLRPRCLHIQKYLKVLRSPRDTV